ncbi:MAG TPA: hypothetical protein VGB95_07450 [Chitinophagales bacterium]
MRDFKLQFCLMKNLHQCHGIRTTTYGKQYALFLQVQFFLRREVKKLSEKIHRTNLNIFLAKP